MKVFTRRKFIEVTGLEAYLEAIKSSWEVGNSDSWVNACDGMTKGEMLEDGWAVNDNWLEDREEIEPSFDMWSKGITGFSIEGMRAVYQYEKDMYESNRAPFTSSYTTLCAQYKEYTLQEFNVLYDTQFLAVSQIYDEGGFNILYVDGDRNALILLL